MKRIPKVC